MDALITCHSTPTQCVMRTYVVGARETDRVLNFPKVVGTVEAVAHGQPDGNLGQCER